MARKPHIAVMKQVKMAIQVNDNNAAAMDTTKKIDASFPGNDGLFLIGSPRQYRET